MARLKIFSLSYQGDKYQYSLSKFMDGLNIIIGDNGTGKSTFCNLIYFALGGKVDFFDAKSTERHSEITSDTGGVVTLNILLDNEKYSLVRYIGANEIGVSSLDNDFSDVFQIYRQATKFTFSDWILEKLGIDPFKIFLGSNDFFLSWNDLLRLIYHNQNNNPKSVYKEADTTGYMKDSLMVRKIIFESFAGEGFVDLYKTIEEIRKYEKDLAVKNDSRNRLKDVFPTMAQGDAQTLSAIQESIDKIEATVSALNEKKKARQTDIEKGNNVEQLLSRLRAELLDSVSKKGKLRESISSVVREVSAHASLVIQLKNDISQLRKIIHVNAQLSLFSPDTCPCCLSPVERQGGKCICGASIDERLYQRFFYSDEEYKRILKAKRKNLETTEAAYEAALNEYKSSTSAMEKIDKLIGKAQEELDGLIQINVTIDDIAYINLISDQILSQYKERMGLEEKERVLKEYLDLDSAINSLNLRLQGLKSALKKKEGEAETVIADYITRFSEIYNLMCSSSVDNCTSARIDNDYSPIFNNGLYLQDSSAVGKRFCYYLSLLRMAVGNVESKFPRFLLVDTPETKGISTEALNKLISLIDVFFKDNESGSYQIILSTGLDRYPPKFEGRIIEKLYKHDLLLKMKA